MSEQYEVPLVELLESVPLDARHIEEEEFSTTYHPVGELCHQAAHALRNSCLVDLTDDEINELWKESHEDRIAMRQGFTTQHHYFAHLILRKASEK